MQCFVDVDAFLWLHLSFLIELVVQNVVEGMALTSLAKIQNGVTEETGIKTVI